MKKIFLFILVAMCYVSVFAQLEQIQHNGRTREYVLITPSNTTTPKPVMFLLHGLGDDATTFANTIITSNAPDWYYVVPQALVDSIQVTVQSMLGTTTMSVSFGTAWNAGINIPAMDTSVLMAQLHTNPHTVSNGVDDSGLMIAILDELENSYQIDTDSVFCTGFSFGGYMTNRVAIEHGDRFTAIASVSGTIGNGLTGATIDNVNALHIHGTLDPTVLYADGTLFFTTTIPVINLPLSLNMSIGIGAESTRDYWRNVNATDLYPISFTYSSNPGDTVSFERQLYCNGDPAANGDNTRVGFIKAIGMTHLWATPSYPIDYFTEIIAFFRNEWDDCSTLPTTHTVSGKVLLDDGVTPINLVDITYVSGSTSNTVQTNTNGEYSFPAADGLSYTITASKPNYTFSAPIETVAVTADLPDQDFVATFVQPQTWTVSGKVLLDDDNSAVVGVTITYVSGATSNTVQTNTNGEYSFIAADGFSYTISASKSNYTFSAPITTEAVIADLPDQDFVATLVPQPQTWTVSGTITDADGVAVQNVTITYEIQNPSKATVQTNASGEYDFQVEDGATVIITPSKEGFRFIPASDTVGPVTDNTNSDINFMAEELVSLNSTTLSDILVYPNPANTHLTVVNAERQQIEILNVAGQVVVVINNAVKEQIIDLSSYANGNYFVKINNVLTPFTIVK